VGGAGGEVKGRLERGRERLRHRLARRGVTLSAGLLAALAAPARALPRGRLVDSVVSLASPFATPAAAGRAALLAQGVLQAMKLKQAKTALTAVLLLGTLAVSAGGLAHRARAGKPAPPAPTGDAVKSQDAPKPAAVPAATTQALTVRGRVLDPTGNPVAGAKLYLPAAPKLSPAFLLEAMTRPTPSATTGPDGRFQLSAEPTPLGMGHTRPLVVVADGYAADWADPAAPGPDGTLTLRLV